MIPERKNEMRRSRFSPLPNLPAFLSGPCAPSGDGGNDVSMIQESDCGVGVEGKVSMRGEATCRQARGAQVVGAVEPGWGPLCSTPRSFCLLRDTAVVHLD